MVLVRVKEDMQLEANSFSEILGAADDLPDDGAQVAPHIYPQAEPAL